jgi:hypothetical protein
MPGRIEEIAMTLMREMSLGYGFKTSLPAELWKGSIIGEREREGRERKRGREILMVASTTSLSLPISLILSKSKILES